MSKNYIFKVTKRLRDANIAHRLLNYDGPCKNIHGHTYHFEITIGSDKLDSLGMVIDFNEIKKICDDFIQDNFDHGFLIWKEDQELLELVNKIETKKYIFSKNTTAENLAEFLFHSFRAEIEKNKENNCELIEVKVWETETSVATYTNKYNAEYYKK